MERTKEFFLKLSLIDGIGNQRLHLLYENFRTPENILNAKPFDLKPVLGVKLSLNLKEILKNFDISDYIKKIKKNGIKVIFYFDDDYPEGLKNISNPPFLIYLKGKNILNGKNIAIVGTRRPTSYGINATRKIVKELLMYDFQIVSGFARGIDTEAHLTAIEEGGKTVAVFGSGIDIIYPPENKKLYEKIISSGGCVISEFPLSTPPLKSNFPLRNRLISGISFGVVIVEAPKKSGALITADYALNQGREVFAVPGSIFEKKQEGSNRLIQEGAKPVIDASDIISEFGFIEKKEVKEEKRRISKEEQNILSFITTKERTIEEISFLSGMDISKITEILLNLELKGWVRSLPGSKYIAIK